MAADNKSRLSLSLDEFLQSFPPPQIGFLQDGYTDEFDNQDSFNLGPGSRLEFHQKLDPNIPLSFLDPWGGPGVEHWIKVTLPLEFPGRFNLLPFDPISKDYSVDHIYSTVGDLVKAFPIYVQANRSYGYSDIEDEEGKAEASYKCGDRFKLIRQVYKNDDKLLECRLINSSRLLCLPMHSKGDFTVVPDNNTYLLSDLVALPPRRRRIQVVEDSPDIPGLPKNFQGELFVDEPEYFVEVSPAEDRSLIIGLPHDSNMNINPDEMGLERGQQLNNFATNNSNLFPLVARVTDWEEETNILENHYIRPGVELVIHGWTRQTKILAKADNQFYAIPLTYQGRFRIKPQQFVGVSELEKAHPAYKIKVLDVTSEDPECPIGPGDILRIRREDSMKRHTKPEEIRHLKCEKFDPTGRHKIRDVKIPTFLLARFEEVLEDMKASVFTVRELVSFVEDQELTVELAVISPDQKVPERDLPPAHFNIGITMCDVIMESAVYVSVEAIDAPAFHVPLRTLLYVTFLEQLEKSSSPLLTKQNPKLSTLDRCVELLPEEVYVALAASKQGGPEFPRFKGATAFSGPSTTGWQKEESQSNGSPVPNGAPVEPVFTMQKQFTAVRQNRSTENLLKPVQNDELTLPRGGSPQTFDEFSFARPQQQQQQLQQQLQQQQQQLQQQQQPPPPPPQQNGHSTAGRPHHVAVAHSDGGQLDAQFRSLQLSRSSNSQTLQQARSVSTEDISAATLSVSTKNQSQYSSQPNLLQTNTLSVATNQQQSPLPQPPPGYMLVPQGAPPPSPQQFQVPPGYALVPVQQQAPQTTIPPGFMLVPYQQQPELQQPQHPQQPLTMANVQQMQYGTLRSMRSTRESVASDSDNEDAMTNFSKFTFSSKAFKVAIPQDGNLYHFSTKKMAELFRQLKIEEPCIRACLKDRIDGKKFSKMMEGDLERYGLMHPVVIHFRNRTMKKKPNFML